MNYRRRCLRETKIFLSESSFSFFEPGAQDAFLKVLMTTEESRKEELSKRLGVERKNISRNLASSIETTRDRQKSMTPAAVVRHQKHNQHVNMTPAAVGSHREENQ